MVHGSISGSGEDGPNALRPGVGRIVLSYGGLMSVTGQEGNQHPTPVPTGSFEAADGMINVAAAGDGMFAKFCQMAGRDDWLEDVRYRTNSARSETRQALLADVAAVLKSRSSESWIDDLSAAGVGSGPICTIDKMFEAPKVRHLNTTRKVSSPQCGEMELLAPAYEIGGVASAIRSPAPELGQHTDELLAELATSKPPVT